jgi:signal transduction histidine kinase
VSQARQIRGYWGNYPLGLVVLGVVIVRAITFYQGQPRWLAVLCLAVFGALYAVEPWLKGRFRGFYWLYFPLQTALIVALSILRPYLDFTSILYVPLSMQVLHAFSRRAASAWFVLYIVLLGVTQGLGMGWMAGLAFSLLILAGGAFSISYDLLYTQAQADQVESQVLLAELQQAHLKLQGFASQAKDLAAARERNRLARELHDSVSQEIFSIMLITQSTRLLLERDPGRVSEEIIHLQEMTSSALGQLRSLIAQLHPPQDVRPEK